MVKITLGIVTLCLVLTSIFVFLHPNTATPASLANGIGTLRSELQDSIRRQGAGSAYAAFKNKFDGADFSLQHNASHIFGELLYAEQKVDGVTFCDSTFNFGCYHGFFTASVKGEGISIVPELDAVCSRSSSPGACQHGLGHGILEFLGRKNLSKALEACALTKQTNPVAGCTSGVFMEYNVPLIIDDGIYRVEARTLDAAEDPYTPCNDVENRFRKSCYHELAQWWYQIYAGDYIQMGQLCEAVVDSYQKYYCYAGIGNITGSNSGYDPKQTISFCNQLPLEGVETCLENAAWSYVANTGDQAGARAVCGYMHSSRKELCMRSI